MTKRPGGKVDNLPLHFIWIADCSGSMGHNGKIQALNQAIRESIPHMRKVSDENPRGTLKVRSLAFGGSVRWHDATPTDIHNFDWTDLSTGGGTPMGQALKKVGRAMDQQQMPDRALPPVLVLLSDGQPTDDFKSGLDEMMQQKWCEKAVRMAISIGDDADDSVLQKFIGHPELKPLQANNPEALAAQIRWVSTEVVQAASAPRSRQAGESMVGNVPSGQLQRDSAAVGSLGAGDVW